MTINQGARALTIVITVGFFIAGFLDILDYIIVKILLIGGLLSLIFYYIYVMVKT